MIPCWEQKPFSILSLVINAYEVAHPPGVTRGIDPDFQKFDRALKTQVRPVLVSLGAIALPGFHR
jgi:hypothetical protein